LEKGEAMTTGKICPAEGFRGYVREICELGD